MRKVGIVTGGAGGIGSVICQGPAADGLRGMITDFARQAAASLADVLPGGGLSHGRKKKGTHYEYCLGSRALRTAPGRPLRCLQGWGNRLYQILSTGASAV